jgi:FkbM family methyltransferase
MSALKNSDGEDQARGGVLSSLVARRSSARAAMLQSAGRLSRTLHARGLLRGRASGAVRLVARKAAAYGTFTYRDYYGNETEADLSDYMERCGFFGAHSAALVRFIASTLRPGDWAIDAGANVGLFTSPMAAAVGPQGSVWAIEPLPRNLERLERLKQVNRLSQLELFPLALGSATSTARLRLPKAPGGSGFGSFVATWASAGDVEVATRPLDDLVAAGAPAAPLRLVKIDVEGSELDLLAGARTTLTTRRPLVLCEFHDPLLRSAGTSADELLALFRAYGYAPRAPFPGPGGSLHGAIVDILLVPD